MARGGIRAGAGRPTGSENSNKKDIEERLNELNCDPIEGMVGIAEQAMQEKKYALAGQMYKELTQYIASKKRPILNQKETFDLAIRIREGLGQVTPPKKKDEEKTPLVTNQKVCLDPAPGLLKERCPTTPKKEKDEDMSFLD